MPKRKSPKVGSRAKVMHGNAHQTSGGLTKKSLRRNKRGRIVSRKKSASAKKKNLLKDYKHKRFVKSKRKSPKKRKSKRKSCRSNQRRSRKTGRCRLLPHIAKARRRASARKRKSKKKRKSKR